MSFMYLIGLCFSLITLFLLDRKTLKNLGEAINLLRLPYQKSNFDGVF